MAPNPSSPKVRIEVPAALGGERLDRVLAFVADISRREAQELVDQGAVQVNGSVATTRSRTLRAGDVLVAAVSPPEPLVGPAADPDVVVTVVHEDADLIVVDKPAGLVVHHGAGHRGGTLVDGLLARYPDLADLPEQGFGAPDRPGIVHRLDKGTSGLLVVARTARAYESLTSQLRDRVAGRDYTTLVWGSLEADAGIVDAPIGRSTRTPTRMAITERGRPARTSYRVRRRYDEPAPLTLCEATLQSGRTHQVRVHLASIGHPVVGDDRYGRGPSRPEELRTSLAPQRVFLHARRLSLQHPAGGTCTWESELPTDLRDALDRCRALGEDDVAVTLPGEPPPRRGR
jgi:23S rRNA pseudouridine1911/1915/1917 synthase